MKEININLLKIQTSYIEEPAQKTTSLKMRIFFICSAIAVTSLIGTSTFSYTQTMAPDSPIQDAFNHLFRAPLNHFGSIGERALVGEERDRINILILGIGGKGHDGTYLSDTMLLASMQPSTKKAALISIPRDLLVEIDGYGWRKINNADA